MSLIRVFSALTKTEIGSCWLSYRPDSCCAAVFRTGSCFTRRLANSWVPIHNGSPRQESAAILAFILSHDNEPVVLDQPEDDLDNHLIYDLIVGQCLNTKFKRQLIIVTHNLNIVVNGDADMVIAMDFRCGQCVVPPEGTGCLQDASVRSEICNVIEGGEQAFRNHYKRLVRDNRHA